MVLNKVFRGETISIALPSAAFEGATKCSDTAVKTSPNTARSDAIPERLLFVRPTVRTANAVTVRIVSGIPSFRN